MDIEEAKHYLRSLKKYCEITPTSFGNKTKMIHIDNLDIQAIETVLNELDNKDKEIKEKIEWLREISDNGINAVRFAATHDDEIERMQKQKDISTMIGILQELLKESD